MHGENLKTFCLEEYVKNTYNYLNNMVDRDSLPYFNVFWTEPAQAAHDWPDFGDVISRQLQAAMMARHITGQQLPIEKVWYEKIISLLDPVSGLLVRPQTGFSESAADMGDQALTLYGLMTVYLDHETEELKEAILKMCKSMLAIIQHGDGTQSLAGFSIKSLMMCARYLKSSEALEAAEILVNQVFHEMSVFTPDNAFRHGGHMHGNLRCLLGAADYALYTKDAVLFSRIDAIYRYVRSTATRFGFLPEVIGRTGDIVACETCALMDYIGLAVTLANHGHPEYWGDIERVVRNHLVESQITDVSWLKSDSTREDTEQFSWRDIGDRMVGGYAGWSSPNHILACREDLHWGGPELRGKTRAFQNCCGGSGTHAFYIAWKNSSEFHDGCLSVNMHIDKLCPQAEIRCWQPYSGKLTVELKEACNVRIRIPDFTDPKDIILESDSDTNQCRIWGNYLELGQRAAGEKIQLNYPLPLQTEEVLVGNPDGRKYQYRALWKGDSVVTLDSVGNEYETGYSDFDNKDVPVYYGTKGPGLLYKREHLLDTIEPELAQIQLDDGTLNFWNNL